MIPRITSVTSFFGRSTLPNISPTPQAGHLSDDSSKGILIAAGSYTLLSAFVPQQILIVMYLLANITIGAYMMKVDPTFTITKAFPNYFPKLQTTI